MAIKSPLPIVQERSDIEIEFQLALVDKTIVEETS